MSTESTVTDRRPPLEAYVQAAMPDLIRWANIEREADLPPGSIVRQFEGGMFLGLVLMEDRAEVWVELLSDASFFQRGRHLSHHEKAALAARIGQFIGRDLI